MTGIGTGSMYANALVWIEGYIPVKGRIAAALNGAGGVGVLMAPLIVGGTIETTPMVLPILQISITCFSIILFSIAGGVIGRRIVRLEAEAKQEKEKQKNSEEMQKLNAST